MVFLISSPLLEGWSQHYSLLLHKSLLSEKWPQSRQTRPDLQFSGAKQDSFAEFACFFQSSMAECIAFKWSESGQRWRKSNELSGRIWASLPCREVRRSIGGTRLNPFSKRARNIEKLQPWKYGKYRYGKVISIFHFDNATMTLPS